MHSGQKSQLPPSIMASDISPVISLPITRYRVISKKTMELFESFPAETKLTVAVRDWLLEKGNFVQVTITGNQECKTSCGVFVAQTVLDLLKKRKQRILPEETLFQEANELIASRGKRFSPLETEN
jgi:hypothetical protein